MRKIYILLALFSMNYNGLIGQSVSDAELVKIIEDFKSDARGPYKDIKWFCEDGTIREARDPCPGDMEGVQHARYKDIVRSLHEKDQLFFGKILVGTEHQDFWDHDNGNSAIKQYILNTYLEDIDDGWIKRKAQFYRGSIQSEDELAWAKEFFEWALSSDSRMDNHYLLLRQAAKAIPHQEETEIGSKVRVLSKVISDAYTPFMALRTKIHSTPESTDIPQVEEFQNKHNNKMSATQRQNMEELLKEMREMFKPVDIADVKPYIEQLEKGSLKEGAEKFYADFDNDDRTQRFERASELLWFIRSEIKTQRNKKARLAALDLTIILEKMIANDLQDREVSAATHLVDQLCYLNMAIAGAGYIEQWEYARSDAHSVPSSEVVYIAELNSLVDHHRRIVEWAATNMTVLFTDVTERYTAFEPLSKSFIDDQIRSTLLLPYGNILSKLADFKNKYANIQNDVLGIKNQERIRGLNPGYALGTLEVIDQLEDDINIDKKKIYIFRYPPSDLGPVSGIMTVNEGNVVSHVQLLARNLGIPNAVISDDNMKSFMKYNGDEIFYAVSLSGNVIMKPASKMNSREKKLFEVSARADNTITVDTDRIDLERDTVINMRALSGKDSGISCGPKAANLAQLKQIFPENVVEGVVIPFGVYKKHMDQPMETRSMTYWEFINQIFIDKANMLQAGMDADEVECIVAGELALLRENIVNISLTTAFKKDLEQQFVQAFGKKLGQVPVFLRSDTNMEDLKDFTGAGLNLTKFNILDADEIYKGIKEVWASPFTERSYKWRQSYLNNPENVYPSILVIPSVDGDYSGVVITKDINNGSDDDMTIAFSRGVGGAVDGQRAETYIIKQDRSLELVSPSRENRYRTIPASGGSTIKTAGFSDPILTYDNMNDLIQMVDKIKTEIPKHTEMEPPYDVELGFKDNKIWLFQIRPFVENKSANSSDYLQSISSATTKETIVNLNQSL